MKILIKAIRRIKKKFLSLKGSVSIIEPLISLSKFTTGLYYLFLSSSFRREQVAVLKGKILYNKSYDAAVSSSYLLRRNIHRLEKGLIMRPLKPVFASTYIEETVNTLASLLNDTDDSPELRWSFGVLDEYFKVVSIKDDKAIEKSWKKYGSFRDKVMFSDGPKPYVAGDLKNTSISPEQFADLCLIRRSVRWYENRKVPRDSIDRAILAAGTVPSACNRQPFHYYIYDDSDLLRDIARIPMGTSGFSDNYPGLAVLVGDLSAYFDERDRHVIYIDAALSAMAFMFALQTEGISTCSLNWPDIENKEKEIRKIINLPDYKRIIMLISLGYARKDGLIPSSIKKPLEQLRSYNQR